MEELPNPRSTPPKLLGMDETGRFRIFELSDGRFAFVGEDITDALDPQLPAVEAARAPYERIIAIPRNLLIGVKGDIPEPEQE